MKITYKEIRFNLRSL